MNWHECAIILIFLHISKGPSFAYQEEKHGLSFDRLILKWAPSAEVVSSYNILQKQDQMQACNAPESFFATKVRV